jgi:hypothetical protein
MTAPEAQRYARIAGLLLVITFVAGGFGESYVPGKLLVATDVAETTHRLATSLGLFRISFASYLIEAACDLALTAIFYLLLRPVSRPLSLIVLCFGLFSTTTFSIGEVFYFAAALPIMDADVIKALSPQARLTFTYLCLTVYGYVFAIFTGFYGVAVALRGYLIFRSRYLPRTLGVLVMLGGAGFIVKNCVAVFAPAHDSMAFVLPMLFAMLGMAFWFLVKGIDPSLWEQRSNPSPQK